MSRAAADMISAMGALNRDEMLARVRNAGIVGMGGGGFPAHVKYGARVDTVVANGAECEPLLWSDKNLMLAFADEVVSGLQAVMSLTGAGRGVLAAKGKYKDVIEALERAAAAAGSRAAGSAAAGSAAAGSAAARSAAAGSAAAGLPAGSGALEVRPLRNVYPAGDEFMLVQETLGRTIPEMGLPLHVGAVVNNVGTLRSVARAVLYEEPVVSRLVSVTGAVREPLTVEAPIGTPFKDLLEAAGGTALAEFCFIAGGPMMGRLSRDPEDPVLKTTSGLLILPLDHPVVQRRTQDPLTKLKLARAACCLCMECTEVCPRNLIGHSLFPHRLMRNVSAGISNDMQAFAGAFLCCECGLCTVYGCPMGLDPCRMNVEIKTRLRAQGFKYTPAPDPAPSEFFSIKQVPLPRLISRLGLSGMERRLPLRPGLLAPERVTLSLGQSAGARPEPQVKPGDKVRAGQLVATPTGHVSAALHASIDGTVERVNEQCIVIAAQGGRL